MSRPRKAALPPALENIEKLQKVIEGGNYYGAQQMYKSISARYVSAERYSEALDILESGACLQLKRDQITCGAELAASLVDTLVKGKFPCNDEMLGVLARRAILSDVSSIWKIYEAFPRNAVPDHVGDDDDMQKLTEELAAAKIRVEGCSSFLKASLRWSIEFGSQKSGSPELHAMLAEYIYSESLEVDMSKVSYHFVRGNNPSKFASVLVNFLEKCYPGEDDLAIARAVLMYLALGNLRDANYIMDEVKQKVDCKELEFPKSELIELIVYLLQTISNMVHPHVFECRAWLKNIRNPRVVGLKRTSPCDIPMTELSGALHYYARLERDALPLFRMLRQNYTSSIDREPTFNELLDEIAERFYGLRRKNPMQGMFGDIFKMMGDMPM